MPSRPRSWCWCTRPDRSGSMTRSVPGSMGSPAGWPVGLGDARARGGGTKFRSASISQARRNRVRLEEIEEILHEEVAKLPKSFSGPVILCCLQGLSYDEAGRRLGLSEPTLRGQLHRARKRLASRLRDRGITGLESLPAIDLIRIKLRVCPRPWPAPRFDSRAAGFHGTS